MSKSPYFLLNKIINSNKNETELKMQNPTHTLRETNLLLPLIKNRELKIKLWWAGARERKKGAFFCNVYFVQKKLF